MRFARGELVALIVSPTQLMVVNVDGDFLWHVICSPLTRVHKGRSKGPYGWFNRLSELLFA